MTWRWTARVPALLPGALLVISVANACGGNTDARGGSSETNFIVCTTDEECPAGEHCVERECRPVVDARGDAEAAGFTCSSGDMAGCYRSCPLTWAEASTRFPDVCMNEQRSPYQAICGNYSAIIDPGVDAVTTSYYDKESGALFGQHTHGVGAGISWDLCSSFSPEFVLPEAECTPPPGAACNSSNADGGTEIPDAAVQDATAQTPDATP